MKRTLLTVALLFSSAIAASEPLNLYIADDFHPVEDITDVASTAAAVVEGPRIILVRDGQVPRLNKFSHAILNAQKQNIQYVLCEVDLENFKGAVIPPGFSIIRAPREGEQSGAKTTYEKKLQKLCAD